MPSNAPLIAARRSGGAQAEAGDRRDPVGFVSPGPWQRGGETRIRPRTHFAATGCAAVGFVWFCGLGLAGMAAVARGQAPAPSTYAAEAAPLLARYCGACHNPARSEGGVNVGRFGIEAAFRVDLATGRRILEAVEGGAMPPDDAPRPTSAERATLVAELQSVVAKAGCATSPDPGRVTLRRLNRAEYNNTIRDLIGVDCRPADDFPADDVGHGFDNDGDVLGLPPLLMERYLAAAEAVADLAIVADDRPRGPTRRWAPAAFGKPGVNGQPEGDAGTWLLSTNGEVAIDGALPRPGDYLVRVRAHGHRAGADLPRLEIRVDGKAARAFDVKAEADAPAVHEARIKVRRPGARLAVAFTNDAYHPDHPDPARRDRNLSLGDVEVVGPLYSLPDHPPPSHARIIFRRPGPLNRREVAREVVTRFATRAYRRPATDAEVARLAGLVELAERNGDRFERGVQLAVAAVLTSPHFLFRVELEQRPGAIRPLTDLELASRLSYFLWSSMPDDELRELATRGRLRAGGNLDRQVDRMLRDPKAAALAEDFAGQWLQARNLKLVAPDRDLFPAFDEPLRHAMGREVELFFAGLLRDDRPITDLLHADYTYLNERLARHYGIAGVVGDQFRRVPLVDRNRGGVVTMAAMLTVTSNPTRTSPVKRGKWILDEILGTPPPPPPPGVSDLPDAPPGAVAATGRARLERHRADPACAGCHGRLDPLGFGLESFDAVGALRATDEGRPVDASGVLPGGPSFRGPVELKAVLLSKQVPFSRNFAAKLMTYALGRGLTAADRCAVEEIAARAMLDGGQARRFVLGIVHADAFGRTNAGAAGEMPR